MKKADIRGIGERKFIMGTGHFEGQGPNLLDTLKHINITASFDRIKLRNDRIERVK